MTNARGADYSVWDDDNSTAQPVNFNTAKAAGLSFVFIKSSQAAWADQDFLVNWANARTAGIPRGAYHFLDWTKPALDQARFFCGLLKSDPGELPPVLDYECRTNIPGAGTARLAAMTFLQEVLRQTGVTPIIYTSPGYWSEFGSSDQGWARFPLWIANVGVMAPMVPAPWTKWTFWQDTFQGDGPKYGAESKSLDLDWFNGSEAALTAFAGAPPTSEPEEEFVPYAARTTASLNIRATPGGALMGTLVSRADLRVEEEDAQGLWAKVSGWVSTRYITRL